LFRGKRCEKNVKKADESREQAMPTIAVWTVISDSLYPTLIRALCGSLMATLGLWMGVGVVNTVLGLKSSLGDDWTNAVEHVIINTLMMLALLEVIRTLQAYLKLGRVRVTFILDTALVVLIGELMGLWFREFAPEKVVLGLVVIVTLVVLRIITARYSPDPAH
jgi:uncharacterized membrane protein (DUF373 family)